MQMRGALSVFGEGYSEEFEVKGGVHQRQCHSNLDAMPWYIPNTRYQIFT